MAEGREGPNPFLDLTYGFEWPIAPEAVTEENTQCKHWRCYQNCVFISGGLEIYVLVFIINHFWHLLRVLAPPDFSFAPGSQKASISIPMSTRYNRLFSHSCSWDTLGRGVRTAGTEGKLLIYLVYPFFNCQYRIFPRPADLPADLTSPRLGSAKGLLGDYQITLGFIHRNAPSPTSNSWLASKETVLSGDEKVKREAEEERSTVMPETHWLVSRPVKSEDLWFNLGIWTPEDRNAARTWQPGRGSPGCSAFPHGCTGRSELPSEAERQQDWEGSQATDGDLS